MLKHTLPDTPGKSNVIARAVQLTDIRWTPVGDVPTYTVAAGKTVHKAFVEVTGLPYSSTEPTDKFICENLSIDTFLSAVQNPDSALYTRDLNGHRNSWTYFGIVCNGLARYALNIRRRYSTKRWLEIPGIRLVAEPGAYSVEELELCDILYAYGKGRNHVAMVTDILRDETGAVALVEVSEAVRPSCKRVCYTPQEYYEKYKLFGISRYDYLDDVPPPVPVAGGWANSHIAVDYGHNSNYFSGEDVVLTVFDSGVQQVELFQDGKLLKTLEVAEKTTLSLEPGWYRAVHTASGCETAFCVCRPLIEYTVKDGVLSVKASSTDPRSRVLFLDLREESHAVLRPLDPQSKENVFRDARCAPLAQVVELTEEEKETGIFSRPIHPEARYFKVCYENPNGIWTHTMLPLYGV